MNIKPGTSYIAHRQEIVNPKPKYHLFLSQDIVFLINSKRDYYSFDIPLTPDDCSIIKKNCYLSFDVLYKYDVRQKIITSDEMSENALARINNYLKDTTIKKKIPKIFVDRAIGILEQCILDRKLQKEIKSDIARNS